MKIVLLTFLSMYQIFFSPLLHSFFGIKTGCRFSPSCSDYARQSINHYGTMKGVWLSAIRLSKCQPFNS